MDKRQLDLLIISGTQLGTSQCHALELLQYLKSVRPEILVLNGGFIEVTKFDKDKLSKSHQAIIREVINLALAGTKVYYVTPNKKQLEQDFDALWEGAIQLREKLDLRLKGQRYWFFPGVGLEPLLKVPAFLLRPGSITYRLLSAGNKLWLKCSDLFKRNKNAAVKSIDQASKRSPEMIEAFEERVTKLALEQGYDYIACAYAPEGVIKQFLKDECKIVYMNAGNWSENLSSLEFRFGKWKVYHYDELDYKLVNPPLKSEKEKVEAIKAVAKSGFGSIVE